MSCTLLACSLTLSISSPCLAQSDDAQAQLRFVKAQLDFYNWPGKDGLMKPGFIFKESDYPELSGFTKSRDALSRKPSAGTERFAIVRNMTLTNGTERVLIELQVTQSSTDDAQEELLANMAATQAFNISSVWLRGNRLGVNVGDVNFVEWIENATQVPSLKELVFVRNNVRVSLARSPSAAVNLSEVASRIDRRINALPSFTKTVFLTKIPVISAFAPVVPTIPPNASTDLTLVAFDPQGQTLRFLFESDLGDTVRDESVNPPTTKFSSAETAGQATIVVFAVSEGLLFSAKSTTVQVQ